MATTREKMEALKQELRETAIADTSTSAAPLVELVQMGAAFGVDLFDYLIPSSDAEADIFVDQLIALLVRVRGDDLPPLSQTLYGETTLNGDDGDDA